MVAYRFEWRHYHRSFRQPLRTHHGSWAVREGIIVRLQDIAGQVGWGEIAPIPWFGSETIDQAIDFCESLGKQISEAQIAEIPDGLPACQFGLAAALETLRSDGVEAIESLLSYSVLLSPEAVRSTVEELGTGDQFCLRPVRLSSRRSLNPPTIPCRSTGARGDFETLDSPRQVDWLRWLGSPQNWGARGAFPNVTASSGMPSPLPVSSKTYKSKIGIQNIDREIVQLDRLLRVLPEGAKLRLDANGGLSETEAYRWLEWCDHHPQIEFLEQPLPPDRFESMQCLSQQFQTPIALDESVATIAQLQDCHGRGWRGIFVIKPAIAGFPDRLRQFCREAQPDVVWSSALETGIGRRYIEQRLIPSTSRIDRAIGFGVDDWFADDWGQRSADSLWQLAGVRA